jgi:predicted exporter
LTQRTVITLVLTAVLFVVAGLFVAQRLTMVSGIGHFLSEIDDVDLAAVSSEQAESPMTRAMVLFVRGPDLITALQAARQWSDALGQHPEVEEIQLGPDPDLADQVYDLYFPRRYAFLPHGAESNDPASASTARLEQAAKRLRQELESPRGPFIKEFAGADPLLAFPDLITRFQELGDARLDIVDGQFAAPELHTAALIVTTKHSAFDSKHQGPLEDFIVQSFSQLKQEFAVKLELKRSGIHRFAVASERQGMSEMQRMSTLSMVAISLLFLVLFRSWSLLAVAIVPLVAGILIATASSLYVFGGIHMMTLVFGATLIGVCIDYPIHYICHHTLVPDPGGPMGSLRRVWPAISMGALTTIAGFGGLAWSNFPGIRELGFFAATGVLAALFATRLIVPALLPRLPVPSATLVRASRKLNDWVQTLRRRRGGIRLILFVFLAVAAAGVPFITWEDDVYNLNVALDPEWAAEEQFVRDRISKLDLGRLVVAIASDEEQALILNDTVYEHLKHAVTEGRLENFESLHRFLPSKSAQEKNSSALRNTPDIVSRYVDELESVGFRAGAFEKFAASIASPTLAPLTRSDFDKSLLAPLIDRFYVKLDERVAILTFVSGVADPDEFKATFDELPGVQYFDQQSFIAELYGQYRGRVTLLVGAGLLAVALLVFARFRSFGDTIAVVLPALTAAAATLAILTLCGATINLLHLLGLLLVLSIGVDYSIFLIFSDPDDGGEAATILSLCIACVSTCLSFGLLSLSAFPALQALGMTTALGTLLSLILAPVVLTLIKQDGAT